MSDLQSVISLYEKFSGDLRVVRDAQRRFYFSSGYFNPDWDLGSGPRKTKLRAKLNRLGSWIRRRALRPQLDDIEAEVTYLRIRSARPEVVVEMSPCGGWSSTWILSALRDNQRGTLHSYDLVDAAIRNIPSELKLRWMFHQGDVTQDASGILQTADYLFIDSDHSAKFAHWYITALFPKCRKGIGVSVHDVFHTDNVGGFDNEGAVLMEWLEGQKRPWFTASAKKNPAANKIIVETKKRLGLDEPIHVSRFDPMVFFEL